MPKNEGRLDIVLSSSDCNTPMLHYSNGIRPQKRLPDSLLLHAMSFTLQ